MRLLCPTGSEHIQERYIGVCDDLSDSRSETHVDRMRSNGDGYQLRTVRAEGKARRKLATCPFVGEHGGFSLDLLYRADEVPGRNRRPGDVAGWWPRAAAARRGPER